ncbi:efflux RND transporter periplasmic adaptor subunit [Halopseudomonas bauzanensis]|uniref:Membrane fusion protein, multidrug efflux system n=1 Tax=Halopseudomonas bauzanensis TaxID=653930 RepID=A0A1I4N243_9GAMM|nr:efflux RND transporter periplasmic adaptor subunit [Halopseudomonas bauzanensis]SES10124.1 membrane fusion protein, multidrug efflux system [Halopseudomonas bauzanensis]SFM09642.1 membrane fusion protein, multidrug efflux system [Halopseudomonas bauzanensis]
MTDSPSLSVRHKRLIGILILLLILIGIGYLLARNPPSAPLPQRSAWSQPTPVRVVPVQRGSLDVQIRSIGTVTPLNAVTVRSRVDGELTRVLFTEGAEVEQGTLLAEIDPAPYRAQLAQAEGLAQQNQAQLANAQADLELYEGLYEQDSIARQQLTSQRALVEELRGTLKANAAQVEDARLQLSWTRIEAPIAGKLGLRRVDAGNLVSSSDTEGLVSITQMRPIAVEFTVPEPDVPALRRAVSSGEALAVQALDRNEQQVLARGQLHTMDNQIDIATGTLRVKALFENGDDELFPNQFVNVRLRLQTLPSVITIPSDAVQFGSRGTYVYVINAEESKAYTRLVKLGATADGRVAVTEGLEEQELVVLEGLDRLRDGREVVITDGAAG